MLLRCGEPSRRLIPLLLCKYGGKPGYTTHLHDAMDIANFSHRGCIDIYLIIAVCSNCDVSTIHQKSPLFQSHT